MACVPMKKYIKLIDITTFFKLKIEVIDIVKGLFEVCR